MNIQNLSFKTYCKGKMQYTYENIAICCDFYPSKSLFVVIVERKELRIRQIGTFLSCFFMASGRLRRRMSNCKKILFKTNLLTL